MTCEIAVANRLGIALAADSAVTFTRFDGQQTYASGANKILQLAANEPIAALIYNSANLGTIPWELILKEYRRAIGHNGFRHTEEYKSDLIRFINESKNLLPASLRYDRSSSFYYRSIAEMFVHAEEIHAEIKDPKAPQELLKSFWQEHITVAKKDINSIEVDSCLEHVNLQDERENRKDDLIVSLRAYVEESYPHLKEIVDYEETVLLGVEAAFKNWRNISLVDDYTGIVIGGYGQGDFLPSYWNIRVFGFIGDRIIWRDAGNGEINHDTKSSLIQPFAQRAMVETFTQGASPEVWKSVRSSYLKHATSACKSAALAAGVTFDEGLIHQHVEASVEDFTRGWAFATFDAHLKPLQSIVSSLSVPELAEIAETLVMLESLKEKVTSRTQSVGGPIDVAVITRAEGLVWIKRKLFFEPQLNQRYMLRLQRQYGG